MQFDRNGVFVRQSQPVRRIRTVKKVITIDSRDRDPTKYVRVNGGASTSDPGDYVVYLPRVYENVVSLRLKNAVVGVPSGGFTDTYVLLSLEGLNRIDETATGANRAGFVDNAFAKLLTEYAQDPSGNEASIPIRYNDNAFDENITRYTPPIGRLDRFHITWRYHPGTVVISPTTSTNAPITFGTSENTLTFEIEYIDNVFEDVSTFETQLDARASENSVYTVGRGY